ncbi:ArgR family transcriptional regulator [Vagococcus penaei]|uniref:arginine repressor n=1 Tax=Vagococcus penaei TaxID=633807 RepID=UPI0030023A95
MIKRLISENDISKQSELMELLEKEDIQTTQATISRDIRELNIIKNHNDKNKSYYRLLNNSVLGKNKLTDEERLINAIVETGVSLRQIEFTNLLTVLPGNGQVVGVLIDSIRTNFTEIVGCVAGDDTILILSENKDDAKIVNKYFQQYLYIH